MAEMKNTRYWDQLKTTDPRHTKAVEFGRRFTSIDAHWQLQRMTEVFGPCGEGWGYQVAHSIERIRDDMVYAVADVTIWWDGGSPGEVRHQFGPVRGLSPLVELNRKTGKLSDDEDAPKKAMTDALTKGLSHIGVSADVFLGMYDDNKYVQRLKQQIANGDAQQQEHTWTTEAKADGLMNGTPPANNAKRKQMEEWTDKALNTLRLAGMTTAELTALWHGWGNDIRPPAKMPKLESLQEYAPDLYAKVEKAYHDAVDAAQARAA